MNRPGWIKLYNQTLDSDFWNDPEPFSLRDAFIHVLLSANWRDGVSRRKGHKVIIKRGQLLTSIRRLADTFHWNRDRVYRWLRAMKDYEMLESESLGFGTLLTVVNYDSFQNRPDAHGDIHGDTDGDNKGDAHGDIHGDTLNTRSKNIDIRLQKEEKLITADAGTPPAKKREPPIGSPEWYALHYDG